MEYKINHLVIKNIEIEKLKFEYLEYLKHYSFDSIINDYTENIETKFTSMLIQIHNFYTNGFWTVKLEIRSNFWDIFPYEFWDKDFLINCKWKKQFTNFILEFGIEKLTKRTVYNNIKIGSKLYRLKKDYRASTRRQQIKISNYWDCIPIGFWDEDRYKLKKLYYTHIKKYGIEKLLYDMFGNSKSNLSLKANKILLEYKKSSYFRKMDLKRYWNCFPDKFWDLNNERRYKWKIIFIEYGKNIGFENLKKIHIYNGVNIRQKTISIKTIYNNSTPNKQKRLKKIWDCFPDKFWERKIRFKKDIKFKELYIEYSNTVGFENFRFKTIYKGVNLGYKFNNLKTFYNRLTNNEKLVYRKFWDCFPDEFWDNKENLDDKSWKDLFIEFIKENGIENLMQKTVYSNANLGVKSNILKLIFNKSTNQEQEKLKEFWDCFPDDFWIKKKIFRSDIEWKILFIEYGKNIGFENLIKTTVYQNVNLGNKANYIKAIFQKSTNQEQEKLKEFWDCFPDDFLEIKFKHITDKEWKKVL